LRADKQMDKFQVSLDYLTEYSGVKCAVICDREGLVISKSPQEEEDDELYAAAGLEMIGMMDRGLARIVNPGCDYLSVKTAEDWVIVAQASKFYLIVRADRSVDDLLNIRVSRSLEMISSYLEEKYKALLGGDEPMGRKTVKSTEATYV
jgi:predicted regulator of Ras-like GTPase activity (Roadblock/LC7/MglB family)